MKKAAVYLVPAASAFVVGILIVFMFANSDIDTLTSVQGGQDIMGKSTSQKVKLAPSLLGLVKTIPLPKTFIVLGVVLLVALLVSLVISFFLFNSATENMKNGNEEASWSSYDIVDGAEPTDADSFFSEQNLLNLLVAAFLALIVIIIITTACYYLRSAKTIEEKMSKDKIKLEIIQVPQKVESLVEGTSDKGKKESMIIRPVMQLPKIVTSEVFFGDSASSLPSIPVALDAYQKYIELVMRDFKLQLPNRKLTLYTNLKDGSKKSLPVNLDDSIFDVCRRLNVIAKGDAEKAMIFVCVDGDGNLSQDMSAPNAKLVLVSLKFFKTNQCFTEEFRLAWINTILFSGLGISLIPGQLHEIK